MAVLSTKSRKKLSKKTFGLPAERKYPMPDKSHASNAKARAKQMLDKGKLSEGEYKEVVRKANKKLYGKASSDGVKEYESKYKGRKVRVKHS